MPMLPFTMSSPPTQPGSAPGQEAQDALLAVMADQADRREKQKTATHQVKKRSRAPEVAAMVLAIISAWVWIWPPGALQPPPIPPPPPIVQESGLRMDVYMVAVQILRFQSATGTLPSVAEEAVIDPIRADRFEYADVGRGIFRLTAVRDGHVVVYSSDQSLTEFLSNAQIVLLNAPY